MKKIVDLAHDFLSEVLMSEDTAVDFTCGQGFDTCFLATHCKKVYAFDIQQEAIELTRKALMKRDLNAELILASHTDADRYVSEFKAGIFNLGYLPHGDKKITTQAVEVMEALDKMLTILSVGGRIVLVLYPGFDHGMKESDEIEEYCAKLPSKYFDVTRIQLTNRNAAPYLLLIDKH